MKKYISDIRRGILLFVFAAVVSSVSAQEPFANTPAALEFYKQRSLWMNSSNAAGSYLDNPMRYASIEAGYSAASGDFRRPQQGYDDNSLRIGSEGSMLLQNFYGWGRFSYDRNSLKDVQFNSSITDPYRGMPYYVADTLPSDWKRQFYNLEFRIATRKLWNSVHFGLDGEYLVSTAAKQRDLRVDSRYLHLELRPGVVYSPTDNHHIGANFQYISNKEESDMDKVNDVDQLWYALYGVGSSSQGGGSYGRDTDYSGNTVGGAVQYNYTRGKLNLLINAAYSYKVENAKRGFTNPEMVGTVKEKTWQGRATLGIDNDKLYHHISASVTDRDIDGIEYISQMNTSGENNYYEVLFKSVRSNYKTQAGSLDYSLWFKRAGGEYKWKAEASVRYSDRQETYLLPRSVYDVEKVDFYLGGKGNFALSEHLTRRLLVGAGVVVSRNLSGEMYYGGLNADSPIVTRMLPADYSYCISDYVVYNISAAYSQRIKGDSEITLYGKADFNYRRTSDFGFNHRSVVAFTLGCNF